MDRGGGVGGGGYGWTEQQLLCLQEAGLRGVISLLLERPGEPTSKPNQGQRALPAAPLGPPTTSPFLLFP